MHTAVFQDLRACGCGARQVPGPPSHFFGYSFPWRCAMLLVTLAERSTGLVTLFVPSRTTRLDYTSVTSYLSVRSLALDETTHIFFWSFFRRFASLILSSYMSDRTVFQRPTSLTGHLRRRGRGVFFDTTWLVFACGSSTGVLFFDFPHTITLKTITLFNPQPTHTSPTTNNTNTRTRSMRRKRTSHTEGFGGEAYLGVLLFYCFFLFFSHQVLSFFPVG